MISAAHPRDPDPLGGTGDGEDPGAAVIVTSTQFQNFQINTQGEGAEGVGIYIACEGEMSKKG
jgi:hypothetical protein